MSVSKELPEGWKSSSRSYYREDIGGVATVLYRETDTLPWVCGTNRTGFLRGKRGVRKFRTAEAAMAALDREYPMAKSDWEEVPLPGGLVGYKRRDKCFGTHRSLFAEGWVLVRFVKGYAKDAEGPPTALADAGAAMDYADTHYPMEPKP